MAWQLYARLDRVRENLFGSNPPPLLLALPTHLRVATILRDKVAAVCSDRDYNRAQMAQVSDL